MAEQQSLNATFFAFKKRDKMLLLPATVTMLVMMLVLAGVFLFLSREAIGDYVSWMTTMATMAKTDAASPGAAASLPTAMLPPASVMNLFPMLFLFQVVQYIVLAAWEAACLKWMIRDDNSGLFGLSLGADTWRVYFTYWLWFLLLVALYFVCILVGIAASIGLFGAAASMQGKGDAAVNAAIGPSLLIAFAIGLALLAAFIYLAVRFAPAAATSIAEKRFAFFDAWKVSRGRFWPLLGAFAILYLMFIVGYFIFAMGFGLVMMTTMFSQMGGMREGAPPPSSDQIWRLFMSPNFLAPMGIFYLVVIAAVLSFSVTLFGINARAARVALEDGKITQAT